jgi:regulatory protein
MQFSLAVSNLVNLSVALQVPSLTARALRLLSTREHSRAELERKLQQFEEEPGALARVLDALAAKDFINDDRVVGSVLYRRAGKLGAARIKQELQAKGLAPERVTEAVANLRANELWRKKFGTQPQDAAERAKQMRFLAGRGFGGDTIHRVVSGADED